MLHRRFLNPRILAVLPFYLSSSFSAVQAFPTLHVTLPPNSPLDEPPPSPARVEGAAEGEALYFDVQQQSFRVAGAGAAGVGPGGDQRVESSAASQRSSRTVSSWASIHLARAVQLVRGCKEAIFEEFKKLELAPGFLTVPGLKYDVSDEFDAVWANWERCASRSSSRSVLSVGS